MTRQPDCLVVAASVARKLYKSGRNRMTKPFRGPKTLILQTPFVRIWNQRVSFGAFSKEYDIVDFGPRVGVLVLRADEVLLVRQYRFLVDRPCWEIPGGSCEPGESLAAAARREVLEETGFGIGEVRPLLTYYPGLDNVDNRTSVMIARVIHQERAFIPDPAEVIEIAWLPLSTALEMVFSGEILDAMTAVALTAHIARRHSSGDPG
ncbi:NUDIX hydrolase [Ferrovibrio xuzhouensis]|uniref:NUDIX hydrolase n=1 Tax=Ferrovibrio xuzhouensis TaxID=1576914 RepID=A0ABV7VBL6_9PROT